MWVSASAKYTLEPWLTGNQPYTYDECDVGTAPNQTLNGEPEAATVNGDKGKGGALSWLPGQRLSRCTCQGESHPGPKHSDGTFVGRAAPEIDILSVWSCIVNTIALTDLRYSEAQVNDWACCHPFVVDHVFRFPQT